ncbi:MAG TPA: hypothetical protein VMT87_10875 [Vicinamibacteria bacterium]|nr:hypothetical protein [Vicinamibacteria bacterium]
MTPATAFALLATPAVTWVKVEKPVFDLVGVVLYSLGLAGICALVALVLGGALGAAFIARSRRRPRDSWSDRSFQLLDARRP